MGRVLIARGKGLSSRRLGVWGERIAALYLRVHGYRILQRDLVTPLAQIDILAQRGRTIVVCEVKSRRGSTYEVAVRESQRERLQRAGEWILGRTARTGMSLRLDLIVVDFSARRLAVPRVRHFKNAFS